MRIKTALLCIAILFSVSCAAVADIDVEGSARLVSEADWVAGSNTKFEVEYTVGSKGIPVDGGVAVAFLHALNITPNTDPNQNQYVKVIAAGEEIKAEYIQWPAKEIFPGNHDLKSRNYNLRHGVFAKVTDKPLTPGDTVRFIFGANEKGINIPPNICENPFRVAVDFKGDGKYYAIERTPSVRIIGDKLDHLYVTIPATRVVGDKADICIRGEDHLNNLSPGCDIEVSVFGLGGGAPIKVKLSDGIGRTVFPVAAPGVYRATVSANGMTAASNPMVVTRDNSSYGVYWGDIHSHSTFSDGLGGDADYLYTYARDAADLDVCASSEHAIREGSRIATRKFNEPGRFVTIWGYEWAESLPGRLDRNIYFSSEDDPLPEGWPKTIEEFWKSIEEKYGDNKDRRVIVGPHMFTYKTTCRPWYETWNDKYERFVEIYSEHGMSEYLGNPRMLAGGNVQENFFVQDGLKYGRKFGILASSDTHDTRPGRGSNSLNYRGGIVAFLAKDLTRESIWDAWWNRRFYAATNDRIYIDFQIDGHVMGEEITTSGKPAISYTVYGCDNDFDVFLIKNNLVIKQSTTVNGEVKVSFKDEDYEDSSYYYLRVIQKNGEWAWSSPIWVDKAR